MDVIYYIFAAAIGTAALLASIAIWAPRKTPIRVLALVAMTLFLPIIYAQFVGLLSKPKPVAWEWMDRDVDRAQLLSVSFDEGKAIYVWLRLNGMIEPRSRCSRGSSGRTVLWSLLESGIGTGSLQLAALGALRL